MRTNREHDIHIDTKSIYYTLNHYDKDKDNKLSFKEFLTIVLPLDNSELRARASQRATYKVGPKDFLDPEIEHTLAQLLYQEILIPLNTNKLKDELLERKDFNLVDAFKAIDVQHERLIGLESLSMYLMKNKVEFREEDVVAFLRRFDFDLDCNLSLSEFASAIKPIKYKYRNIIPDLPEEELEKEGVRQILSSIGKSHKNEVNSMKRSKYSRGKSIEIRPRTGEKLYSSHTKHRTQVRPFLERTHTVSYSNINPLKQSYNNNKRRSTIPKLMKKQAKKEHLLEDMRESIAVHKDMSIGFLYKMFDSDKGYVTPINFMEVYNKLSLNPSRNDIYTVFNRFDRNLDGKITYEDICDLFIPRHKEYSAAFLNRKSVKSSITNEGYELLKNFMKKLIDVELNNAKWKKNLIGMNLKKVFEQIDIQRKGYFTIIDVKLMHDK